MEKRMQESIDNYIELYDAIQYKTGDEGVTVAILQEIGKDKRMNRMSDSSHDTATEKQKGYLKVLGIEFSDSITKQEASELIEQSKK